MAACPSYDSVALQFNNKTLPVVHCPLYSKLLTQCPCFQITMADEDLSLNEDQLLDSLDDANGDSELMNEVSIVCRLEERVIYMTPTFRMTATTKLIRNWRGSGHA